MRRALEKLAYWAERIWVLFVQVLFSAIIFEWGMMDIARTIEAKQPFLFGSSWWVGVVCTVGTMAGLIWAVVRGVDR